MIKVVLLIALSTFLNAHTIIPNTNGTLFTQKEKQYIKFREPVKICLYPRGNSFIINSIGDIEENIVNYVFSKNGLKKQIVKTNTWSESLKFIKEKKCDLLSSVHETERRKEYINFTHPYYHLSTALVTGINTPYIIDLKILDNKKLAVVKDHAIIDYLKKKYPKIKLILVKSVKDAIQKVKDEEVFAYIEATGIILPYIINVKDIKINRETDISLGISFGIRKGDETLLTIIEKTLQSIPIIDRNRIYDKLIQNAYKEKIDYSFILKIFFMILLIILVILYWNFQLKKAVKKEVLKNKEKERLLSYYMVEDAMENFVGNISHQWKQPINRLSSVILLLEGKLFLGENITKDEITHSVKKSREIINLLAQTVNTFSSFYKKSDFSKDEKIELIIDKIIFITKQTFKLNNIEIEKNIKDDISIKGNELQQVLLSIFDNINNVATFRKIKNPKIKISVYKEKNLNIIQIEDNCGGIDKDKISHIFELGKTYTKDGSGLGLFISKRIIQDKYGGTITAQNSFDGAVFSIKIPKNRLS